MTALSVDATTAEVDRVAPCEIMYVMSDLALNDNEASGADCAPDKRGEMPLAVFNSDSRAAKVRIVRMADRGSLAVSPPAKLSASTRRQLGFERRINASHYLAEP